MASNRSDGCAVYSWSGTCSRKSPPGPCRTFGIRRSKANPVHAVDGRPASSVPGISSEKTEYADTKLYSTVGNSLCYAAVGY